MTNKEAAWHLGTYSTTMGSGQTTDDQHNEAKRIAIKALKQEPCEDCISREAAISCVTAASMCDPIITQKRLKLLPSVHPKTEWIPVIERLPEEDGYYITTTLYREVYCDYWNGETFKRTEIVLAWMPLPEPYRRSEG